VVRGRAAKGADRQDPQARDRAAEGGLTPPPGPPWPAPAEERPAAPVPLRTIALEWTRIGLTGFGGPPAHVALLRRLVVDRRRWLAPQEFEDAFAGCSLLPGPASTQLAIYCARRVRGPAGAVIGGLGFIVPAVVLIVALSVLFLASAPPLWVRGAGAGAGAAVPAVAVSAAAALLGPSWARAADSRSRRLRWAVYVCLGIAAASALGTYVALVLLGCGLAELVITHALPAIRDRPAGLLPVPALAAAGAPGGFGALAWVAFKVGALSFGGGFVIIPLMRGDAVHTYHWMTSSQFLSAVALGQVTPGPVVATVAAVGYAAHGVAGAALGAIIAFLPSFLLVLAGGQHFERLRYARPAQRFLDGAGPAALGSIVGAAFPLAAALHEGWQFAILAAAAVVLLAVRRAIVPTLLVAGLTGAIIALAGGPLP
jgi:chromate transporter